MRVIQLIRPDASPAQRKLQRIDAEALAATGAEVASATFPPERSGGAVIHVYGTRLSASAAARLPRPWLFAGTVDRPTLPWRKPVAPNASIPPGSADDPGDAVADSFFLPSLPRGERLPRLVGSVVRSTAGRTLVDAAEHRVTRFRDDVRWIRMTEWPDAEEMRSFDAWVDPATGEGDLEGAVAEAMAASVPVVAVDISANRSRLEGGSAGFLVPAGDPNEMVHALLSVLFKPEIAEERVRRARSLADQFAPSRRAARLLEIYRRLLS